MKKLVLAGLPLETVTPGRAGCKCIQHKTKSTRLESSISVKESFLCLVRSVVLMFMVLASCMAMAADLPEFDGAYIKTKAGGFIELVEHPIDFAFQIVDKKYPHGVSQPVPGYLIMSTIISIEKEKFKGITLRGYPAVSFRLHPIIKVSSEGENDFRTAHIFDNKRDSPDRSFYAADDADGIRLRTKSIGSDGYYYEPAEQLKRGKYILFDKTDIMRYFLIEIK